MPDWPVSRSRALAVAAAVLVLLLIAGRFMLDAGAASEQPLGPAAAAVVSAAPAPPVVVHVVGAVREPGLYRLARGKRVADAVARAGGATGAAELALINLAAPVSDGQQVIVPSRASGAAETGAGAGAGGSAAGRVSLSAATLEQLDALPGIGPVTAQKIVDYREQHGAFGSVRELDAIPGIGPARLEQLRELVSP